MSKINFKPGSIIIYDNKEYIVIKNYGTTGLIKENSENGVLIQGFKWCLINPNQVSSEVSKDELQLIDTAIEEYEDFFKEYKI